MVTNDSIILVGKYLVDLGFICWIIFRAKIDH